MTNAPWPVSGPPPGDDRPPRPVAQRRRRPRWLLLAGGCLLLTIAIGAGVVVSTGLLDRVSAGPGADTASGASSGDRAQWTAAVCADDSDLATSSNFRYPQARNIAYCATKATGGAIARSLVMGEWPRDADPGKDLARLKSVHWFATVIVGSSTTVFALLDSWERSLLEPLIPFGFQINRLS